MNRNGEKCGSTNAHGKPCKHFAGWGTDHVGKGPCSKHDEATTANLQANKAQALELLEHGTKSLRQIAKKLEVHPMTILRWRNADKDFNEKMTVALRNSDQTRVHMVEDSVFERIIAGKASAAETIFYLVNRAGDRWKHIQRHEVAGVPGSPIEHNVSYVDKLISRIDQMAANLAARN